MTWIDWTIVIIYLGFAFGIAFVVREKAGAGRESYFLASRSMPWWLAGISIAATTFAADTPLAICGIVAKNGVSGNWIWLTWMGVHALVVVQFAKAWRRSEVATDAEFIPLRYPGRSGENLRLFRAFIYGGVYNVIILGWVMRAMGKIADPYFHWNKWTPWLTDWLDKFWPVHSAIPTPSEGLTIILFVGIVAFYSTMGGIRGVILTDLVQFTLAMVGSFWLASVVMEKVGGPSGLVTSLRHIYGPHNGLLDWFASVGSKSPNPLGLGFFGVGLYLITQSFANVPADGGGYLMQRLATVRTEKAAQKAAGVFYVLQYLIRIWPWLVVGLGALVLIPIGHEAQAFGGQVANVANDRESAYPALMKELLPTGVLGMMVASLIAAFMSTLDTHLNWGASYVIHDILRPRCKAMSDKTEVLFSQLATIGFAIAALIVCFQINTIEQAWKWVAAIGASLGVPTILRWFWWRISSWSEIFAGLAGLSTSLVLGLTTNMGYENRLVWTMLAGLTGTLLGLHRGKVLDATTESFHEKIKPIGWWIKSKNSPGAVVRMLLLTAAVIAGTVLLLRVLAYFILGG